MAEVLDRLTQALAGRYAIERELGAGGMATVYLAQDVRHDRRVALKVLRPELAAVIGADRFLQEIRVTANLQHPHILPLFDSGEADSFLYYVMPFVEGESLRDQLSREKQLPVADAVRIAGEVASALDYAHRHEVIHRDIKPENILLQDGQALVADFGIALAVRAAGGSRLTETGLSLGTPHYMSPEQATADRELDARSDIYSLSCVLYEMLAGEPPHTGPTVQSVIAKVLTEHPRDLHLLRESVPLHVEFAVTKALAKLPADRFHDAAEFAAALTASDGGLVGQAPTITTPVVDGESGKGASVPRRLLWPALTLVATIAGVVGWLRGPQSSASPLVARYVVTLRGSEQLGEAGGRMLDVSPDGTRFVYVGVGPNGRRLYVRPLDQFEARPIPGTEDASYPFFSPDGEWVGFFADGKTKKVALAGGTPITITEGVYTGGSWGPGDVIVLGALRGGDGLNRVSATGGVPEAVTAVDSQLGETAHGRPEILPNGKAVLFVSFSDAGQRIAVASLESGEVARLVEGTFPRYAASGHLIFLLDGGLYAAPFDAERRVLTGDVVPVETGSGIARGGVTNFVVSGAGSLVYLTEYETERSLVAVDRQGREQVLTREHRAYDGPRYSPNGRRVALRILEAGFHIWVYDVERGTFLRLTFSGNNFYPEWTPDGERVAFTSNRDADPDLYWKPANGSGTAEPLLVAAQSQWETSFAPDGRRMVYRQNDSLTGRDIWMARVGGGGDQKPEAILETDNQERAARVSPDGRYIAYVSDETGRAEVFVRTFPEPGGKWQISTEGGNEPIWARSARELYYRHEEQLVAVSLETEPILSVGKSEVLFEGPYIPNPTHANYDVHPDGDRFVMVKPGEGERQVIVVLNWVVEMARRVGG